MLVRTRKEGEQWLVYFLDSRRLLETNESGAEILHKLLNNGMERDEIVAKISRDHGIPTPQIDADVGQFLDTVLDNLQNIHSTIPDHSQFVVPVAVELQITPACNLRCTHCFQSSYAKQFMPMESVCDILDTLAQAGVFEINIIGGEPTIHPHFFEIVEHCEKHHFATSVTTNATLLTESDVKKLSRFQRLHVLVSLDGIGAVHDRIRGKGTFAKTAKAIKWLLEQQVPTDVLCTLNSANLLQLQKVVTFCRELGVTVNFNLFKPFKPEQQDLVLNPEAFFQASVQLHEMRQRGEAVGMSNAAIASELMGLPAKNECTANISGLVIDSFGRMVTCPGLVDAGFQKVEDLPQFSSGFLDAWHHHSVFRRFRENGLAGCQVRSFIFCRDVQASDPYAVSAFRNFLVNRKRMAS